MPATRLEYWAPKLMRNVARFEAVRRALNRKGWSVIVVWECRARVEERLNEFVVGRLRRLRRLSRGRKP